MALSLQLEYSLKAAEELIDLNNKPGALKVLHEAIMKTRKESTMILETIMIKHVDLCVHLSDLVHLQEGLAQYRNIAQNMSPQSLVKVIEHLRNISEEYFHNQAQEVGKEQVSLYNVLLIAVTPDRPEEDSISAEKFVWEVYLLILDLLKTNGKMLKIYGETAKCALNFCIKQDKKTEFNTICELLHSHQYTLFKSAKMGMLTGNYVIDLDDDEQLKLMLHLKFEILTACSSYQMWKAAFQAATDTHEILMRRSSQNIKHNELAVYYHFLSTVFWHSKNYVLHAYAQYLYLTKNQLHNRQLQHEQLVEMATQTLLASLAIPTYNLEEKVRFVGHQETSHQFLKLARMLGLSVAIDREQMFEFLRKRNVLGVVEPMAHNLFEELEGKFSPLDLAERVRDGLEEVRRSPKFGRYAKLIDRYVAMKVIAQLSQCYSSISIQKIQQVLPNVNWKTVESIIVDLAHNTNVKITIDHHKQLVLFADKFESQRATLLLNLKQVLGQLLEERPDNTAQIRELLHQVLNNRSRLLDEQNARLEQARQEIRNKEQQKRNELELKQKEYEQQQIVEQERLKEQRLMADRLREVDNLEKEKDAIILGEIKSIISKIFSLGGSYKETKFNDKRLDRYTDQELVKLNIDEIGQLQQELQQKAESDRIRHLQAEMRKMDHLERARRESYAPILLEQWQSIQQSDLDLQLQLHRQRYDEDKQLKDSLAEYQEPLEQYKAEVIAQRKEQFDEQYAAWQSEMRDFYKKLIVDRARIEHRNAEEEQKQREEMQRRDQDANRRVQQFGRPFRTTTIGRQTEKPPSTITIGPSAARSSRFSNSKKGGAPAEAPVEQTFKRQPVDNEEQKVPTEPVRGPIRKDSGQQSATGPWRGSEPQREEVKMERGRGRGKGRFYNRLKGEERPSSRQSSNPEDKQKKSYGKKQVEQEEGWTQQTK